MAHRVFTDSVGRQWDVWSVVPERAERRRDGTPVPESEERRKQQEHQFRVRLGDAWSHGWLCFETVGEKRRLAPIPSDWTEVDDQALELLCAGAKITAHRERLG